jgi:hypothetical protein
VDESGGVMTSSTLRITVTYQGSVRSFDVKANVVRSAAPSGSGGGGSGGTSATGNVNGSIASTSMTAIGPELQFNAGATGAASVSAGYNFTSNGNTAIEAQWYRWNGAAFVAVGTAVTSASYLTSNGFEVESGVTANVTGLVANSAQRFQLYARNVTAGRISTLAGDTSGTGT